MRAPQRALRRAGSWLRAPGAGGAVILALLGICAVGAKGQAQGPGGNAAGTAAVPASYVIGPNDVLAMAVYQAPELSAAQLRVDRDGTVRTPYGTTPVEVGGLTTAGAAKAIAAELVKDQLAVDPRVDVRVAEAQSHPVTLLGLGLKTPGTIQAIRPIHLLDALAQVGGLVGDNGAEITIIRHDARGTRTEEKLSAAAAMSSTGDTDNPLLYGGEEVRVMPGGNAYLAGAVMTPGAMPLSDTDALTVRKAIAKAHGLAPAAKSNRAELIHHVGTPQATVVILDLPKILSGQRPDVPLVADDMLYVPVSGTKKTAMDALSRALQILTIGASAVVTK